MNKIQQHYKVRESLFFVNLKGPEVLKRVEMNIFDKNNLCSWMFLENVLWQILKTCTGQQHI